MYPLSQSKHNSCKSFQAFVLDINHLLKKLTFVLVDIDSFKHFTYTELLKLWHNFTTCPKGINKFITEQIERVQFLYLTNNATSCSNRKCKTVTSVARVERSFSLKKRKNMRSVKTS